MIVHHRGIQDLYITELYHIVTSWAMYSANKGIGKVQYTYTNQMKTPLLCLYHVRSYDADLEVYRFADVARRHLQQQVLDFGGSCLGSHDCLRPSA